MHRIRPARRGWSPLAAIAALLLASTAGYTVQRGETLSHIAARHGTTVSALAHANGISNPHRILAGQRLTLPGSGGAASTAGAVHVVQRGETLSGIAVRYGLRTGDVASANGITNTHRIFIGQRLRLPGASGATASAGGVIHTVQRGETLSGIAVRYGVRSSQIAQANGLADANLIRAGARLTIPGASAPAGGQPAAASRQQIGALIERIAREYGWNPAFVKAVAWQESGWNNSVVSHAGAIGIMQVLPETGQRVSRRYGRTLDLRNPEDNIRAGVLFLDELYSLTGRDARMTLAGYFQGLRNVRENGMYNATRRYIDNVFALRERFS
jgi:N-acetylmuramoyl-L-alanine amidase